MTILFSKEVLQEVFSKYGEVGDVYIPRVHGSSEPRGFAFVRFLEERDGLEALRSMEGQEVDGRNIRIQEAKRKRPENPRDFYRRDYRDDRRDYRDDRRSDRRGGSRSRSRGRDSRRRDDRDRDYDRRDSRRDDRDRDYDRRDSRRSPSRSRSPSPRTSSRY